MKIYDISQEVFSCSVYPGDPKPEKKILSSINEGNLYNLSGFFMCSHNGTHTDSPFHFINSGKTTEELSLDKFVGKCYVAEHSGILNKDDAINILNKAGKEAKKRILIKGNAEVSIDAAKIFSKEKIYLVGNESQTVGPENAPMEVHIELLSSDIILLEGIRLGEVCEGEYFLCAQPLNLAGTDGAPCRAILIKF